MPSDREDDLATASLDELTELLLRRDRRAHRRALGELARRDDERVIPHLVELVVIDSIANDWSRFGFPEVMREHSPPRYLELPEVAWPGVNDALRAVADPEFDSEYAWVEWESWYSQQHIDPLEGFDDWKLHLYRSYLPPVGGLLDVEPRSFSLQDVRWGNCDRSFLAALNEPEFVPGDTVSTDATGGDREQYLDSDAVVFGFQLRGQAYAVPRWVLFPHELLNATLRGLPVSLTYCTLCNAPILYDRTVDEQVLTFGSTGMLIEGNKVMFDEETESLWSQHRGVPIAGSHLERETTLDIRAVTQTEWGSWRAEHPDTLALDLDTGFDWDYHQYEDDLGIFRHYWENEDVIQPGVRQASSQLPEKTEVYGVTGDDPNRVWVFPLAAVRSHGPVTGEIDGEPVVALVDPTDDVAVYRAPPLPVEDVNEGLRDADGTVWTVTPDALVADGARYERLVGRHGLWFAFRSQYDAATVID